LLLVLVLSCYRSAPVPPTDPTAPAGPPPAMTIQASAIGPITAKTPGNLIGLRQALPGFEVKPAHLVLGPSTNKLGFNIYKDGEKLLQVLPDSKGGIFSVHALSPKVVPTDRPWKIGAKFNGVRGISMCKCWEEEVVVCFKVGDNVAVSFARECGWDSYSTEEERQDLIGLPIARVLWSPKAFGEGSNPYGGDEYGGDMYGEYGK
jgi:hypothetical protein